MTTPDPVRWLDHPDQALSDAAQASLRAHAQHGPSAAARARMWSRLEAAALAPSAGPAVPPRVRRWWIGAGLVGIAALWLALLPPRAPLAPPPRAASLPSRPAEIPARVAPARVAPARPAPPPAAAASAASEASDPPEPSPRTEPPATAGASVPPRARGTASRPPPAPLTAPDPGAELALLTPARQLLAARPQRALELADEHARRFPQGVFAEERAFLRIEALLRLGQAAQAEHEARAFRRLHPRSTYLERLDALLP
jgi:hypothetical protein